MPDPTTPAPVTTEGGAAPAGEAPATPPAGDKGTTQTPPAAKETALTQETKTTEGDKGEKPTGEAPKGETAEAGDLQITVPKGVETEPALLEGFKGVAKELGLKGEQAQKLADWYFKTSGEINQKIVSAQEQRMLSWAEEAKNDPTIGGANFDATLKTAQSALRQFGDADLTKMLNETGLGNHKSMIALFARIGKAVSEDRMPKGPVSAADGKKEDVPLEQLLYPSMSTPT